MDEARTIEGRTSENEPNNEIGDTDTPYVSLQPEDTGQKLLRTKPAKNKKNIYLLLVLSCTFILILSSLAAYAMNHYNAYNVVGTSMQPTLNPSDTLVLKPYNKYIRNNIVIFEKPSYWNVDKANKEVQVIKRIKGLPGDVLEYKNNQITINKHIIFQFNNDIKCNYHKGYIHTLKDNEYFVMGDNSKTSIDSRYMFCNKNPNISFVQKDMIIDSGRIVFKF